MKYAATSLMSIIILVAVLIPGPNLPEVRVVGFDKFVHLALFGAWAIAARVDLKSSFNKWRVILAGSAFSLFTEVLQVFAEGRTFDVFDIGADIFGLLLGATLGAMLLDRLTSRYKRHN